jgi:RimJ/RimL family protein N-acetyltransferase
VAIVSVPPRPRRHRRREISGAASSSTATIAAFVAEQDDVRSTRRRSQEHPHRTSGGPLHRLTDRLRLTPVGPAHAEELYRLYQDPGIAQWSGPALSRDAARELAAHMGERWRIDGVHKWIAHDRGTGELVGRGGMSRTELDGEPRLEVGWAIRTPLWGRGYATEIGAEALRFAADVLSATEVVAFTEVHNLRSRAVMERLGMRYDREIRRPGLIAGRPGVHPDAPFALYMADLPRDSG